MLPQSANQSLKGGRGTRAPSPHKKIHFLWNRCQSPGLFHSLKGGRGTQPLLPQKNSFFVEQAPKPIQREWCNQRGLKQSLTQLLRDFSKSDRLGQFFTFVRPGNINTMCMVCSCAPYHRHNLTITPWRQS